MARISQIAVKQEPEYYRLTVRETIDFMREYSDFAERTLGATGEYMKRQGLHPMSGPIVCFHNTDLQRLDVEMGWQIAVPVTGEGDICCERVPSRVVASAIDLGPYEEQDPTLMDLMKWIQESGLEQRGPIEYCYLNDADRPTSQLLTQMSIPV